MTIHLNANNGLVVSLGVVILVAPVDVEVLVAPVDAVDVEVLVVLVDTVDAEVLTEVVVYDLVAAAAEAVDDNASVFQNI